MRNQDQKALPDPQITMAIVDGFGNTQNSLFSPCSTVSRKT